MAIKSYRTVRLGFVRFGCGGCKTIFDFVVQMFKMLNTALKSAPSAIPTDKEIGDRAYL